MRRRQLLGAGAAGALALAGCGGGNPKKAKTSPSMVPAGLPGAPDDGAVLAFMLGLEQIQLDFYRRIQPAFRGHELDLVRSLADQEGQHVGRVTDELRRLHGRVPRPRALKAVPADRNGALTMAYRLENLAASAYLGQVGRLTDGGALATVLSLQSVEGRHAAAVGALLPKTATPDGALAAGQNLATVERVLAELGA